MYIAIIFPSLWLIFQPPFPLCLCIFINSVCFRFSYCFPFELFRLQISFGSFNLSDEFRAINRRYPRRALKIFRDAWTYRNELIMLRRKGLCRMFFETSDSFFRLIFISAILSFGSPRSLRKHSIHVIANICCSYCLLSPSHTIDLRLLLRMIVLHIS